MCRFCFSIFFLPDRFAWYSYYYFAIVSYSFLSFLVELLFLFAYFYILNREIFVKSSVMWNDVIGLHLTIVAEVRMIILGAKYKHLESQFSWEGRTLVCISIYLFVLHYSNELHLRLQIPDKSVKFSKYREEELGLYGQFPYIYVAVPFTNIKYFR